MDDARSNVHIMRNAVIMKYYLSENEEQALTEIVVAANALDGTNYTAPLDADGFFLSCHRDMPVAFLAVYFMGDTHAGRPVEEILLFTHPDFRREGRAMRLLRKYLKEAGTADMPCVRFSAYPSPVSRIFFEKLSAIHDHDELLMTRSLDDVPAGSIVYDSLQQSAQAETLSQPQARQKSDLPELDFSMSNACSECGVKTYGTTGYIYGVRTDESHLRQGSAEKLMGDVFARLASMGAETAILQVSSANIPAYRLYEKLGFKVAETLEIRYLPGELSC